MSTKIPAKNKFINEHDEELTRRFGDKYSLFKEYYPDLYKLPASEIKDICYEYNKSPYGDTFDKSVARTRKYIDSQMDRWQKEYFNPKQLDNLGGYTTESAWGYPNNTLTPAYKQMGSPYMAQSGEYQQKQNPTYPEYHLGMLSAKNESENGQKLWNDGKADYTGGWSYGTYQIETKKGTMKDYFKHLQNNPSYQNYYNQLQEAGGYNAALTGAEQFKNTWADLSKEQNFLDSQKDFMIKKKLNPALKFVNDIKGLDFAKRSPVLKDVLFSTAVQHGESGAKRIFHNALGYDATNLTDEDIINKIYKERGNPGNFKSSSQNYQNNIINNRFPDETKKALELLKMYP